MTIELVTGAPGAGKTCWAVANRIVPQAGQEVTAESGSRYERRIVVAGIRGLSAPHERLPHVLTGEKISDKDIAHWNKLDSDGEPIHKRLPGEPPLDVEATLYNWWCWCQPGDLIAIDECQFLIEKGTLNKSPLYYLEALSIHRHYGVDFLFITQSPDFLHSFVRKLVNPHHHVRSVMGTSLCMIYTWDHASNTERITNAVKSSWRRRSKHYALYQSSVAHVKPKAAGKGGLAIAGVLALAVVIGGWGFAQKFKPAKPDSSAPVASTDAAPGKPATSPKPGAQDQQHGKAWMPAVREPIPRGPVTRTEDGYRIVGCMAWGSQCLCYDERNLRREFAPWQCREGSTGFAGVVSWQETVPLAVERAKPEAARSVFDPKDAPKGPPM